MGQLVASDKADNFIWIKDPHVVDLSPTQLDSGSFAGIFLVFLSHGLEKRTLLMNQILICRIYAPQSP